MTELLALHPQTKVDMLFMSIPRPASGVPINALPGWAEVPLYSKLPMLKCPTNQIIFSRAKIGQKLWQAGEFRLYDPYCNIVRIDYDSLHDPHLKTFYSKENNLKRLRKIGKITDQNDVICTLQEFNGYRRLLQRYHLDLINKEIIRRENEQRDRAMVYHAEDIAKKEYQKFSKLQRFKRDLNKTFSIRNEAEKIRLDKLGKCLEKLRKGVERIEKIKRLRKQILAEKTKLHNIQIMQRKHLANDMERKRIILLKKRFAVREARLNAHRKRQHNEKVEIVKQKAIKAWEKRLESRTKQHERTVKLLQEAEKQRQQSIEKRKQTLEKKWKRIQAAIARRSKKNKRKITLSGKTSHYDRPQVSSRSLFVEMLPRKEIEGIVKIALDIEEKEEHELKFLSELPDGVVKTAKHIMQVVVKNFSKDLTQDERTVNLLRDRINNLFTSVKNHQMVNADLVLKHSRKLSRLSKCPARTDSKSNLALTLSRFVSFGNSEDIGRSTMYIAKNTKVKNVRTRIPTPSGSLSSVAPAVMEMDVNDVDEDNGTDRKSIFHYCPHEDRIFIEHFYIKFKRGLIVGVSRRVFHAVRCFIAHEILNTRKELLDIDRHYLTTVMAKSILGYNINSYNFYGNLLLCVNALSSDIIWELQKTILRPCRDPRFLAQPKCRCGYTCAGGKFSVPLKSVKK